MVIGQFFLFLFKKGNILADKELWKTSNAVVAVFYCRNTSLFLKSAAKFDLPLGSPGFQTRSCKT